MKICVGSTNPVKINAVKAAFERVWPETTWEVTGIAATSGVSDQPMSQTESVTGARNRAMNALDDKSDYGVGLEGGLEEIEGKWFCSGWAVVHDQAGNEGIGTSIRMPMPQEFMTLINKGIELGHATDQIFNENNTKQGQGFFGIMSRGALSRTVGYTDAVIAALAPFVHPTLK